jgi:hypothetical protein
MATPQKSMSELDELRDHAGGNQALLEKAMIEALAEADKIGQEFVSYELIEKYIDQYRDQYTRQIA